VLGAFDCRLYRNSKDFASKAFRKAVIGTGYARDFTQVIFAIYSDQESEANFKQEFGIERTGDVFTIRELFRTLVE
jgi:hypothetical protein